MLQPRHHTNCRAGEFAQCAFWPGIGFGYTKATDGRQFQVFKSIVGEANPIQFAESAALAAAQPRHFSIGGEDIFVGELAETQSRGRGFTLDHAQFIAKYAKLLGLAHCHLTSSTATRCAWSPPAGQLLPQVQDALTPAAAAPHVTVVQANGTRGQGRHIEKVRVVPQPFGSLFNQMLDGQGKA